MKSSPYLNKPESSWLRITQKLVDRHPLETAELLNAATIAWTTLWNTTIGSSGLSVALSQLRVPATIVGYFFELLLARELEQRAPDLWRGNRSKGDKDLVYIPDPACSIEIKTSGQAGFKVYGNRSYGQKSASNIPAKKEKSGYYITVNFFEQTLNLIRFGWIDVEDWDPQEAPTGQMAGLKKAVYEKKLIAIAGKYRQRAPVILLDGVGPAKSKQFANLGIVTIGDLLRHKDKLPGQLDGIRQKNKQFLADCT